MAVNILSKQKTISIFLIKPEPRKKNNLQKISISGSPTVKHLFLITVLWADLLFLHISDFHTFDLDE